MSTALANFLFEAANFLLLAAALGFVLWKPVRRALDAERGRHAQQEAETERMRAEAEAARDAAQAQRAAAEREATARRSELIASARKEAAQIAEQARAAAVAERRTLEHELQGAREAQAAALAGSIGRIGAESLKRLLAVLRGPDLDLALIRAACLQLNELPSGARSPALVESARALDAEAERLLRAALPEGFAARTLGTLGAGVRVTTPAGQVDASAQALARQAEHALREVSGGAEAECVRERDHEHEPDHEHDPERDHEQEVRERARGRQADG